MDGTDGPGASTTERLVRIVTATALFGAAAVHLIVAPDHLSAEFRHGLFFLVAFAAQLALGLAVLLDRGGRRTLLAAIVVNAAIVGVWFASRTVGVDGPAEDAGFVDIFSTVLGLIAIAGGILLATSAVDRVQLPRRGAQLLASASVFATVVLVSASISPGLDGGGHSHDHGGTAHEHGGGDHEGHDLHGGHDGHLTDAEEHGHGDGTHAAGADHEDGKAHGHTAGAKHGDDAGHGDDHADGGAHLTGSGDAAHGHDDTTGDHGHVGPSGTTDGHAHGGTGSTGTTGGHNHGGGSGSTPTTHGHNHGGGGSTTPTTHGNHPHEPTWEETRIAALIGGLDAATLAARQQANATYLANQIRSRSNFLRSLPSADAEARIKSYVDWTIAHSLDGEHGVGNHMHGPAEWQTMDPATTATLNGQLGIAKTVYPKFPTAAQAMAAGYFQVTPWAPGIGAHYINPLYLFEFDPAHPSMLLYNGNSSTSVIVGVSYGVLGAVAPAGFAGPNDVWHSHPQLCLLDSFVIGADNTPADLCASVGGTKGSGFGGTVLWMMHLWQVPGWESDWGLMSGESPAINLARTDVR
jgi:hypothetical protein